MKRTLIVLSVLVLLAVGLAFYRGWFILSGPSSDTGSNKVNVNLTVDPDKAKQDVEAVKKKTSDMTGKVTDKAKHVEDETTDDVKSK